VDLKHSNFVLCICLGFRISDFVLRSRGGVIVLLVLLASGGAPAAEDSGDASFQLVAGLLGDKDRQVRAVGLQYVRAAAKGEAATRRFAAMLPNLPPDVQVELLGALADRGDRAARPQILALLSSREDPVRIAVVAAIGTLGDAADVRALVTVLASSQRPWQAAARQSLTRLRDPKTNAAIVALLPQTPPELRAALLDILAARNATDMVDTVLAAAEDPDHQVRLAALGALRVLADPGRTAAIVKLLRAARSDEDRNRAEAALVAVCGRGGPACCAAIRSGMAGAAGPVRVALLRALARTGGGEVLKDVLAATRDDDPAARDEAVRQLAVWPERTAVPPLLAIARQAEPLRYHALAVAGLTRLAGPLPGQLADLALLAETLKLARRPEEKRAVLGVLGGIAAPEALALVLPAIDDAELADEASVAALGIVERLPKLEVARRRAVVQKVLARSQSPAIRARAETLLAP
jgi:HEAT repeat protein